MLGLLALAFLAAWATGTGMELHAPQAKAGSALGAPTCTATPQQSDLR